MSKLTSWFAPAQPSIPEPTIPAAPPPPTRDDTGANIVVGSDKSGKNARVSGGKGASTSAKAGDVLGGLGRGGISI